MSDLNNVPPPFNPRDYGTPSPPPWPTGGVTQYAPTVPAPMDDSGRIKMPQWSRVLFEPQWRYISVRGGRGSGKTKNFARALILLSTTRRLRILCTREVQLSIRDSVYATLVNEIRELGLEAHFDILTNEIRSKKWGGVFIFRGLASETIDSIKSMADIDICWVEEAQAVSRKSYDMLFPTIRADNSQIWFSWNPILETDPIYELVMKEGLPECANLFVNFDMNPWFPHVLHLEEQNLLAKNPTKHKHIWLGWPLPAVEGAIYFDEIMIMQRENRIRLLEKDDLLQPYAVFDLGFDDAMTCGVVQRTVMDIRVIDYFENNRVPLSWFDAELRSRGHENAIVVFPHDGRNKNLLTATSPQEMMQEYGWIVEIVDNLGVENGIRLCRELMSTMFIDKSRCGQLLEHLKRYCRNKHGHPQHDDHSHAADMTRYIAVHANMMDTSFHGGNWGPSNWGKELDYPKLTIG
jgi:phage terminase large subunit